MPFKSEKQRRWMWANDPEMAEEWEEKEKKESATMKITKRRIRRIIREFGSEEYGRQTKEFEPIPQVDDGVSMLDLDDYEDLFYETDKFIKKQTASGYTREDILAALRNILEEI